MVWETMDGITLERLAALDFKHAEARYGFPVISVHRVDMHKELLRLASHDKGNDTGLKPTKARLGAPIAKVDVEAGIVGLDDGSTHKADLIVAADGLDSVVKAQQ